MNFVEVMFWISTFLVIYTYALYPILLFVWNIIKPKQHIDYSESCLPFVTVLIAAHNEEGHIGERLANLNAINYPKDKIEFLVGSDGSNDRTAEILTREKSDRFFPFIFPERKGKAVVLNKMVGNAKGEILVMSDANTSFESDTVLRLVKRFVDQKVGAVCGELRLESDGRKIGGWGEGAYWKYENRIKNLESNIKTTLGATGAVYALRRSLFQSLPADRSVMDDFVIPMRIIASGFDVKYEPSALASERPSNSVQGEFKRKVRIGAANIQGLPLFWRILLPKYGFASLSLWSRKILRWLAPYLILVATVSVAILHSVSPFYEIVTYFAFFFFLAALIGFLADRLGISFYWFGLPYYFVAMNLALFLGTVKALASKQPPAWETVR